MSEHTKADAPQQTEVERKIEEWRGHLGVEHGLAAQILDEIEEAIEADRARQGDDR